MSGVTYKDLWKVCFTWLKINKLYQFFLLVFLNDFVCIKNTEISVFPVKEEEFVNYGSTKVFNSKFSPLMTECLCIPPLTWAGRITKSCGCSLFVLSLAVGRDCYLCVHSCYWCCFNQPQAVSREHLEDILFPWGFIAFAASHLWSWCLQNMIISH